MTRSRSVAQMTWAFLLICFAVLGSGCTIGDGRTDYALTHGPTSTGPASPTDPAHEKAAGNETNLSALSHELTGGMQGFIARPVRPADKPAGRLTTVPAVRTTASLSYTGPSLNATGNDVNISTVLIQSETIPPVSGR